MQAIETKYLPPTALRQARIKAICAAGSLTIGYPTAMEPEQAHQYAAELLMVARQWKGFKLSSGVLPNGNHCHTLTRQP